MHPFKSIKKEMLDDFTPEIDENKSLPARREQSSSIHYVYGSYITGIRSYQISSQQKITELRLFPLGLEISRGKNSYIALSILNIDLMLSNYWMSSW